MDGSMRNKSERIIVEKQEIIEEQMQKQEEETRSPLHRACLEGDEAVVRKLLEKNGKKEKINLEEVDFAGCTCLQLAAAAGHLNIVKYLISLGAKIDRRDASHGNGVLHEAAWRGFSSLVSLLSSPSTVNVENRSGFTALHLSAQAGHNQTTRNLLIGGSNPNLVNTYGDTPLHTSVRYGHAGVTRILLSARALTDIQNKNGDTALHISSAMGRKKLTKILLSSGSNPTLRNHQGETPEDISIRKCFSEITSIFKNPPQVLTPLQRDELRSSLAHLPSSSRENSQKSTSSKGVIGRKIVRKIENYTKNENKSTPVSNNVAKSRWSPYGCHYHPNSGSFPMPNIDSLPTEPLTKGELYYLDLAGNIHKGPMGVSEGCFCSLLSSQNSSNSHSMFSLNEKVNKKSEIKGIRNSSRDRVRNRSSDKLSNNESRDETNKYEDQLIQLTVQLSKIHMDTQAQLSSLHSMLNERLKDEEGEISNEAPLKDWVKQYRRFRKELTRNPKTLEQANELLSNASALLSKSLATTTTTRPIDSETDSGI